MFPLNMSDSEGEIPWKDGTAISLIGSVILIGTYKGYFFYRYVNSRTEYTNNIFTYTSINIFSFSFNIKKIFFLEKY